MFSRLNEQIVIESYPTEGGGGDSAYERDGDARRKF